MPEYDEVYEYDSDNLPEEDQEQLESYKRGGWFQTDNDLVDKWIRIIGPIAFTVFCLFDRACKGGESFVYPQRISQKEWAEWIGIAPDTFARAIQTLENVGLLEVKRPVGRARILGVPYRYKLNDPRLINPPDEILLEKGQPDIHNRLWKALKPSFKPKFAGSIPANSDHGENQGVTSSRRPSNTSIGALSSRAYNNTSSNKTSEISKEIDTKNISSPCSGSNCEEDFILTRQSFPDITSSPKTPPKKEREIIPYKKDSIYNLIQYWNDQPGVPKCKPGTKSYKKVHGYITNLKKGYFKLFPLDPEWRQKHDLPKRYFNDPAYWDDEKLKKAFQSLSLLFNPGYWPSDKSNFYSMRLEGLIYSKYKQTSWLLAFYRTPPNPMKEIIDKAQEARLGKVESYIYEELSKTIEECRGVPLSSSEKKQIISLIPDIRMYQKAIPDISIGSWVFSPYSFIQELCKAMVDKYGGWESLSPNTIKPGSKGWNRLIKGVEENTNSDLTRGIQC